MEKKSKTKNCPVCMGAGGRHKDVHSEDYWVSCDYCHGTGEVSPSKYYYYPEHRRRACRRQSTVFHSCRKKSCRNCYTQEKPKFPKPEKKFLCFGIWSALPENQFCIFADFDGVEKEKIIAKTREIMKKYRTTDFFLIRNAEKENHYHTICPTVVSYDEYEKILGEFIKIGMDKNFIVPLVKWLIPTTILRFYSEGKGELKYDATISCQKAQRNWREMSLAHLLFLQKIYNVDISGYKNTDARTKAVCDIYFTQKR